MTTTNLGLELPIATSTNKIREDFNSNMELIDAGVQMLDAGLTSIAALTTAANKMIYTTASDTYTTTSLSAFGITLIDDADASTARTTLGLAIGTNVQAYDAGLLSIAALTTAANKSIYTTASDTYATYDLTAFAITILDDANAATVRATIGGAASGANSDITSMTGLTTPLAANYGGTGVANAAGETITIGGGFALTLTLTAATGVTLPTSGTLVNSAVATLSSLTSIGTITTGGLGTGAVIAGVTMTLGTDAAFDTYYRGASVLTRLAPNTAASNKFLRMIGTGTAGQAPSWEALGTGDIPDISATYSVLAGNTSLITLGTVTTGTWTATTIKANYLQNAAADLGAANVEVVLSNTNGAYVTNLTTDGTITATVGFAGALTGNVTGNVSGSSGSCTGNAATVTGFTPAAGSLTLAGADALTLTTSAATNVTLPTTGTLATTSNKLSAFAATTSAELAGVISDEIGAGKLRFDTAVTAKTTTATLTEAEAGTILVSAAGGAYTVTLPTASGNTGLTYHFIKTDANYTLITLAANGAETFNYESATGAPVATYARLNTYCAEVTVVSDGSNWQCTNERLGQVPYIHIYLKNRTQSNIKNALSTRVSLDTVDTDIGSNSNVGTWISGTARATTADHLIDNVTNPFTAAMVGCEIKNTTDTTYAHISVVNSSSDVTLTEDIFVDTEGYLLKYSKITIPITGIYSFEYRIYVKNAVVNQQYNAYIIKNASIALDAVASYPVKVGYHILQATTMLNVTAGDIIELKEMPYYFTDNTSDIWAPTDSGYTYLKTKLISKD